MEIRFRNCISRALLSIAFAIAAPLWADPPSSASKGTSNETAPPEEPSEPPKTFEDLTPEEQAIYRMYLQAIPTVRYHSSPAELASNTRPFVESEFEAAKERGPKAVQNYLEQWLGGSLGQENFDRIAAVYPKLRARVAEGQAIRAAYVENKIALLAKAMEEARVPVSIAGRLRDSYMYALRKQSKKGEQKVDPNIARLQAYETIRIQGNYSTQQSFNQWDDADVSTYNDLALFMEEQTEPREQHRELEPMAYAQWRAQAGKELAAYKDKLQALREAKAELEKQGHPVPHFSTVIQRLEAALERDRALLSAATDPKKQRDLYRDLTNSHNQEKTHFELAQETHYGSKAEGYLGGTQTPTSDPQRAWLVDLDWSGRKSWFKGEVKPQNLRPNATERATRWWRSKWTWIPTWADLHHQLDPEDAAQYRFDRFGESAKKWSRRWNRYVAPLILLSSLWHYRNEVGETGKYVWRNLPPVPGISSPREPTWYGAPRDPTWIDQWRESSEQAEQERKYRDYQEEQKKRERKQAEETAAEYEDSIPKRAPPKVGTQAGRRGYSSPTRGESSREITGESDGNQPRTMGRRDRPLSNPPPPRDGEGASPVYRIELGTYSEPQVPLKFEVGKDGGTSEYVSEYVGVNLPDPKEKPAFFIDTGQALRPTSDGLVELPNMDRLAAYPTVWANGKPLKYGIDWAFVRDTRAWNILSIQVRPPHIGSDITYSAAMVPNGDSTPSQVDETKFPPIDHYRLAWISELLREAKFHAMADATDALIEQSAESGKPITFRDLERLTRENVPYGHMPGQELSGTSEHNPFLRLAEFANEKGQICGPCATANTYLKDNLELGWQDNFGMHVRGRSVWVRDAGKLEIGESAFHMDLEVDAGAGRVIVDGTGITKDPRTPPSKPVAEDDKKKDAPKSEWKLPKFSWPSFTTEKPAKVARAPEQSKKDVPEKEPELPTTPPIRRPLADVMLEHMMQLVHEDVRRHAPRRAVLDTRAVATGPLDPVRKIPSPAEPEKSEKPREIPQPIVEEAPRPPPPPPPPPPEPPRKTLVQRMKEFVAPPKPDPEEVLRKQAEIERQARIQRNKRRLVQLEALAEARAKFSKLAETFGGPKTTNPSYPQTAAAQLAYAVDQYVRGRIDESELRASTGQLVGRLDPEPGSISAFLKAASEKLQARSDGLTEFWKDKMRRGKKIEVNLNYFDEDVVKGAVALLDTASKTQWTPVESEDFNTVLEELRARRDGVPVRRLASVRPDAGVRTDEANGPPNELPQQGGCAEGLRHLNL